MVWIFIAVKNRYSNLLAALKFTDSKWTKMSQNEVMQPTTSSNDSRPIFCYHAHNEAGFDNPVYQQKRLHLLGRFKDEFHFLKICKGSM